MSEIADLHEKIAARTVLTADGCWQWTGGRTAAGYGVFYPGGEPRAQYVHRWAYAHLVGPLVEGLVIDHLCRNRSCCNPEHLEQVTDGINVARGMGRAAVAARLDHCPNGHEYTEGNTYRPARGGRQCRTCRSAAMDRFYARRREVVAP